MGHPLTVVLAETQKCSKDGCDGALYWDGSIALSANPQYTLTCRECGRRHNYAHDEDVPSKIRLVTTGEPNPSIEKLEVIEGEAKKAKLVEFFAYEEAGVVVANIPEPDVAAVAKTKPCGVPGCGGELEFSGLIEDMHPARYPMICQKCGANNRYVQDNAGLVIGAKLYDIVPKEPEPEAEAAKPDAPVDLMDAAKLLAKQLNKEVYVTAKPGGGAFRLPGEYWGISLVQDMYDGWYCIHPDGKVMETEQYT